MISGDVIRFTYTLSKTDRFKEVLVLHPNMNGKVHALDLKKMTDAERGVLKIVLDPANKGKKSRVPLINDIMARMNPAELIKSPPNFYQRFVKPFLRGKDVYRTYTLSAMSGVQRADLSSVKTSPLSGPVAAASLQRKVGDFNADSLFKPDKPAQKRDPLFKKL